MIRKLPQTFIAQTYFHIILAFNSTKFIPNKA